MTIQEYFLRPDAERILLLEFQRSDTLATKYFISDTNYTTDPTDTPPNTQYSALIGGSGLPQLRRTLNDVFRGNASTGFGTVELTDELCSFKNNTTTGEDLFNVFKGTQFTAFLAAPVRLFPRSDAIVLAKGVVGRVGGDSRGNITVELTDGSLNIANSSISVESKPLCFGFVRNMTPALIDPATRLYFVHDSAIESIDAVYDDGVLLSPTQYSVNLTNGSFTLNNAALGIITVDVKGAKVSGVWLSSTQQIVEHLLFRAGISGYTLSFGIPSGTIGFLLNQTEQLGSVLDKLMVGVGGYWLVDRLGFLSFRQFPTISGMGEVFTEDELIDEVQFEDDDQVFNKINYAYKNNWTLLQARSGADPTISAFVSKDYLEGSVSLGAQNPEILYDDSPLLRTYFDAAGDAAAVANNVLNTFGQPRKRVQCTVPFTSNLELGQTCTIMFNNKEFTGIVVSVVDIFDGSYPLQKIEILA